MWNERYSKAGFAYGTSPNEFLATVSSQMPKGEILSLGEGEGRNAVHLARLGNTVLAVDSSSVGLAKAQKLAAQNGVKIEIKVADLAKFEIEPARWDGIISIFCHVPPLLRKRLHRQVVKGLRRGGIFVLEAYTPKQLEYRTGGPSSADMMMSLDSLLDELNGLEFLHAQELEREVREGAFHTGLAHVVQILARKPNA